jgi:hypothetical protein
MDTDPGLRGHPQPGRRKPRPTGPVGPDPRGRGHRHRNRGWCLRYPPLPRRRHRARRYGNHTDPEERSGLERGLPGREGAQRNPARTRHYGRAFWKRWTGYHARSRVEAKRYDLRRDQRNFAPAAPAAPALRACLPLTASSQDLISPLSFADAATMRPRQQTDENLPRCVAVPILSTLLACGPQRLGYRKAGPSRQEPTSPSY